MGCRPFEGPLPHYFFFSSFFFGFPPPPIPTKHRRQKKCRAVRSIMRGLGLGPGRAQAAMIPMVMFGRAGVDTHRHEPTHHMKTPGLVDKMMGVLWLHGKWTWTHAPLIQTGMGHWSIFLRPRLHCSIFRLVLLGLFYVTFPKWLSASFISDTPHQRR